jgi:probable phosphoglycerate mutase
LEYSSDLTRAIQTAEKISKLKDISMNIDERISEINLGIFAGFTRADAKLNFPEEWKQHKKKDTYVVPGGESKNLFHARVSDGLLNIIEKHPRGSTICIVTHGGVIASIKNNILKHAESMSFTNTSISELIFDGELNENYWNDATHLEGIDRV